MEVACYEIMVCYIILLLGAKIQITLPSSHYYIINEMIKCPVVTKNPYQDLFTTPRIKILFGMVVRIIILWKF